jgi:CubicO group peptidase (beta-lactamase class C family)
MKKLNLELFFLLMTTFSFTLYCCTIGQTETDKSSSKIVTKSDNLSKILRKTDEMPYLKSLIVLKNDELIIEKYINGGGPDQIHDIRSASKSVLSAIVGIAIKDGYINSIEQKIIDFFPEYITDELDPKIYDLRIRHLITMKSGFNIEETAQAYQQLYKSPDWIEHILHFPFRAAPGKKFSYNSFNTHLLSATITKATGMSTFDYAKSVLFSPLGITKVKWEKDPKGYCIGGWGLSLKAQDMVNFGTLYLNNGLFNGSQVVPSEWIKSSIIERTGMIGTYYSGWNKSYGYGFLWWIKRIENHIDIPFAMGHGGQRIAIIPDVSAVLVTQAEPDPEPSVSFKRHRSVDSFLFDDLASYLLNR